MMEKSNKLARRVSESPLAGSKIPPQCIDMEEAVLGALMIEKNHFEDIQEIISDESFYKDSHGMIFLAISELVQNNTPIDILTVTEQLRKKGQLDSVGGAFYITQLTNRVASTANIKVHAFQIAEKFMLREFIRIAGEMMEMAYDDMSDPFETMDEIDSKLQTVRDFVSGTSPMIPWSVMLSEEAKAIHRLAKAGAQALVGVNTGSIFFNENLGGWRKGCLILEAGRPGAGKTTRALGHGKAAALTGEPVAIFSLEMTANQLVRKYIIEESEVLSYKVLHGRLDDNDLAQIDLAVKELSKLPIQIFDKSAITPGYVKGCLKKMKKRFGRKVGLVIIDYIQLMNADGKGNFKGNREQEVSNISKALKELAKTEDIPVIALAQLSRDLERRSDKRPILADLRESGSLEQDADVVLMLYRPSYYYNDKLSDPDYKTEDLSDEEYDELTEIWIRKNRHGPAGQYGKERFNKALGRFTEYQSEAVKHHEITIAQDTSWQQGLDLFDSINDNKPNDSPF